MFPFSLVIIVNHKQGCHSIPQVSGYLFKLMSSFQTATRSCFLRVLLRHMGGDRIYETRCLFVAGGLNDTDTGY